MRKIIFIISIIILPASYLLAQLADVTITLENNSILEGKADRKITTKGFEGLILHSEDEERYVKLSKLKRISFKDRIFVKQSINYQAIASDILIESFVVGDFILYKGNQLDGERLFFIGKKDSEEIFKISSKGIGEFLNYYFKDCSSWQKITPKSAVYREDWFAKLAQKNKTCFAENENLIIDYQPKKVSFSVGGGVMYYQTNITGSGNEFIYDPEQFTSYSSFTARGAFQIVFSDYISVQQSIGFYRFNTFSPYVNYHPFSVRENYSELNIQLSYLELQSIVRVNLLKKKFSPFAELGLNIGALTSFDVQETPYERNGYDNPPKSFNISKRQASPLFGSGIKYQISNKIEFGVRYNYLFQRFTIILSANGTDVNPNLALDQQQNRIELFFMHDI